MYTLCIVDMQPAFAAAQKDRCVKGVIKEVQLARTVGAGIVVLEYDLHGPTDERINDALEGYERVIHVTKPHDDGSIEFLEACRVCRYTTNKIRVCGVNINWCVASTIRGIKARLSKSFIELSLEASNGVGDILLALRNLEPVVDVMIEHVGQDGRPYYAQAMFDF